MVNEKIRDFCKKRGITIKELEQRAGLPFRTVNRWGKVMPAADKLASVAKVLGTTVEELLGE